VFGSENKTEVGLVNSFFELTPFVEACGLKAPIDLRIVRIDGTVLAEGELDLPCAVAGRDSICEVTLLDAEISLRHACLQAVGGRVLVADIGSRTGLHLSGEAAGPERQPFLWLTPTDPVAIGPFHITLRKPLFVRPTAPETSPFLPDAAAIAALPRVAVKFLNGKTVKAEWIVNRLITFVGRSKDCKISLAADDIAPFHCYFVLTPDGLWVVDLLSRESITVNGEAVRYAHLKTGDFVQVGRFRLGFEYHSEPSLAQPIPSARSLGVKSDKSGFTPVPFLAPKVRTAPLIESATPALSRTPPPNFVAVPSHAALALPDPADPAYAPLMEHFSTAQNQMMEQFQSSMMMMMKMFGEMHREQMTSMQGELGRMAELNTEMQRLQAQLTTMTPPPVAAMKPTHILPDPELVPLMSEESAGRHNWVYERMAVLQAERQSLWQRLAGLMTPKNAGA